MAGTILKGSDEHKEHLAFLEKSAKGGDKAAAANLKQHEVAKPEEIKKDK